MIPYARLAAETLGRTDIVVADTEVRNADGTPVSAQDQAACEAAWAAYVEPTAEETYSKVVNEALTAPGSPFRAFVKLFLKDRNRIAQRVGLPEYTMQQLVDAIKQE